MTAYIPHTIGKVYDVAHLRPFDLELAKQEHPCATKNGNEVRLLRFDGYKCRVQYDWWCVSYWPSKCSFDPCKDLRLAPLVIKHDPRTGKDEPLHVGDVIERAVSVSHFGERVTKWIKRPLLFSDYIYSDKLEQWDWRWPLEVQS